MPAIRFNFEQTPDNLGGHVLRPLVRMRLDNASPQTYLKCLVDTGSPDTCIAWDEAVRAGIDLDQGDMVDIPAGYAVGGVPVTDVRGFGLTCWIEGARHFVLLRNIPVLFVQPWAHAGFRGILGTRAMESIRIEISVRGAWLEVTPESEAS